MRPPPCPFCLPTSLLLFLLVSSPIPTYAAEDSQSPQIERPRGFPPHVKFFPEDPPSRRRDLEAIQEHIIAGHIPVVIKKMSEDESEKFFPEYWGFAEQDGSTMFGKEYEDDNAGLLANVSLPISMRPAFAFHTEKENLLAHTGPLDNGIRALRVRSPAVVLALLQKRGFQCPTGTNACTSIGYPNLCCSTGDGCFLVADTGLGPVGCCPQGASCTGNIKNCEANNTPCPSSLGGGCCLPGYTCAGAGCIPIAATVVTITTTISASSTQIAVATTTTPPVIAASTSMDTSTNTGLSTTLSCPSGDQACPATLGGGCCPTDRICMVGNSCAPSLGATTSTSSTTTIVSAVAPIRPTSDSGAAPTTAVTTSSVVITGGSCPTGYYACSAYYLSSGCCRVGRDCQTTDCPATASTTLVSEGVTIVVPLTGAATTTASRACATGWYSCAASVGGACCPSGWTCGLDSCTTIGPSSTSVAGKQGALLSGAASAWPAARRLVALMIAIMALALW